MDRVLVAWVVGRMPVVWAVGVAQEEALGEPHLRGLLPRVLCLSGPGTAGSTAMGDWSLGVYSWCTVTCTCCVGCALEALSCRAGSLLLC